MHQKTDAIHHSFVKIRHEDKSVSDTAIERRRVEGQHNPMSIASLDWHVLIAKDNDQSADRAQ